MSVGRIVLMFDMRSEIQGREERAKQYFEDDLQLPATSEADELLNTVSSSKSYSHLQYNAPHVKPTKVCNHWTINPMS